MKRLGSTALLAAILAGCVSVDEDVRMARESIAAGTPAAAVPWSENVATNSIYSKNLGKVDAGRIALLAGDPVKAEGWFRLAIDSAVDRKENTPTIKLGDVGNDALAATVTDDRTREYYLAPYEINLALCYGIIAELMNGKREDALVDARLAVYIQDSLAKTYGEDLKKSAPKADEKATSAGAGIYEEQSAALMDMMASTRNSWENPVLWWLTGALFEADGDTEMAWQSYRKAAACRPDNPVFAADATRANGGVRTPSQKCAKLLVIYDDGLVPQRQSLKIPVPIYTAMSIDIPMYKDKEAYHPNAVAIAGLTNLVAAAPALDIRALAARDLDEKLPGVIVRNITRAAVQAGAQAAVNASGNEYAKLAVLAVNAVATAVRRADTRSWATLPDGQQVWSEGAMAPGEYRIGVSVNGRTVAVPVSLAAGDVKLVWISDCGNLFRTGVMSLNDYGASRR